MIDAWGFDCEVFAYDWLFCFKRLSDGYKVRFWNDNEGLTDFIKDADPGLFYGFNNKHYDNYIVKAIAGGFTPEQIKNVNDRIISGVRPWQIEELKSIYFNFPTFDMMDDTQMGTSLKGCEGHFGLPIVESSVPFDIDRPLTEEERKEVEYYCFNDVDATELLYKIRQPYIDTKAYLGKIKDIPLTDAVYMTNAKLTASFLGAKKPDKEWTDVRDYVYPDTLKMEYIPKEVKDFFDRIYDKDITDDELFSSALDIEIGGCPVSIGWGGIHGALLNYREKSTEGRTIRDKDVASYYPHLMTVSQYKDKEYGYISRNIPNPAVYANMLEDRIAAKKSGDKTKANALKLPANTTYGATGDQYNDLYDPKMYRSVCITGQLLLLELAVHCIKDIPSFKLIQLNTDGIMASYDTIHENLWQAITKEWEERTGFELEEEVIGEIIQKDVNNYIAVSPDGELKLKGGMLVRGINYPGKLDLFGDKWKTFSSGSGWKVNNDMVAVTDALINYLVYGTSPETTIANDNEILHYQIIAKATFKYSGAYHEIDGQLVEVQRCNRVYATDDIAYGTLYKKHKETGSMQKIAGLPMFCVIDNENRLDIRAIDKSWYIQEAWRMIYAFEGKEPKKKRIKRKLVKELATECIALLEGENICQQIKLPLSALAEN